MGRSKELGMVLMIIASVQLLFTVVGTLRRSYMVIALPVVTAMAHALADRASPPEAAGNVRQMAQAWIDWGVRQGFLAP